MVFTDFNVMFGLVICSTRTVLPLTNETPVTSPRHSIHHSDSMNSRSPHDHSRNLSTTNDLSKQNSPARQLYSDTRNMGKSLDEHSSIFICHQFNSYFWYYSWSTKFDSSRKAAREYTIAASSNESWPWYECTKKIATTNVRNENRLWQI